MQPGIVRILCALFGAVAACKQRRENVRHRWSRGPRWQRQRLPPHDRCASGCGRVHAGSNPQPAARPGSAPDVPGSPPDAPIAGACSLKLAVVGTAPGQAIFLSQPPNEPRMFIAQRIGGILMLRGIGNLL